MSNTEGWLIGCLVGIVVTVLIHVVEAYLRRKDK